MPNETFYRTLGCVDQGLQQAPRGVAMAIRFMQRNLARPLTTSELAAAAGMSERSLRRQFQSLTGQSPITFHRHLRLEATRNALCDDHAKADITTAAGMHGFSHLSHFTGQYRRRYGELPSATLRALRESCLPYPSHVLCEPISLIVLPFICTDRRSAAAAAFRLVRSSRRRSMQRSTVDR